MRAKNVLFGIGFVLWTAIVGGAGFVGGFVARPHLDKTVTDSKVAKAKAEVVRAPEHPLFATRRSEIKQPLSFQELQDRLASKGWRYGRRAREGGRMLYGPGVSKDDLEFPELSRSICADCFLAEMTSDAELQAAAYRDVNQRPAMAWRNFLILGRQETLDWLKGELGD